MKKKDWIEYFKTVHGESPSKKQIKKAQKLGEFIDEDETTNKNPLKKEKNINPIRRISKSINKKFIYIFGAIVSILFLLTMGIIIGSSISTKSTSGDSSSNKENITKDSKTKESSKEKNTEIETITFTASGDYNSGIDIKPGSYYAVLTKLEYAPDDSKHQGYVTLSNIKKKDDLSDFEIITNVGSAYKIDITDGGKLSLDDGYSPTSWELTLYTPADYKKNTDKISKLTSEHQKKYPPVEKSSSSSSSNNSSSSSNESINSSQTEASNAIYNDSYIEVTKNGGTLSIKNISGQDIVMDGTATFNNSTEINMFDFGFIGDIKKGGVVTQNISKITLMDQGEPGDKESDETLGGNKTFIHFMKKGETLLWSGEITDSDYNTLAQVSFNIDY